VEKPSNQNWQYYFDRSRDALIHYPDDNTQWAYRRMSSTSRRIQKFDPESIILPQLILRDTLVPADLVSSSVALDAAFAANGSPNRVTPFISSSLDYLASLPPVRRRLLARISGTNGLALSKHHEKLLLACHKWDCGSDGGLANGIGTMGFAITVSDTVLWRGSGPVDGDPTTSSSRRSELFGFAALIELLLYVLHTYPSLNRRPTQSIEVCVWIDSTSAIKQINAVLQNMPPRPAWPNDADILSHIRRLLALQTPYNIKPQWVKAHQNTETPP
jgi:ribonuclease HI